jgi:V-type H+-transporting ATPase subunit a
MMFGDFGHGLIIFTFASILVLFNNQLKGTLIEGILPYRYFFFLLGLFATYSGLLYNEFFAIPLNIFPSCYGLEDRQMLTGNMDEETEKVEGEYAYLRQEFDCNCWFGLDPVWSLSTAKLSFVNNVKMKLSVIMGVLHMMIGVIMKGTNAIFFKNWVVLFCEVIVGSVILLGLFGWMDFLIFAKWFKTLNV